MSQDYLNRIATFTEDTLPDLDEVVMGTLQFLATAAIPHIDVALHTRPLVVGSVNGLSTAKILFESTDAVFADEGNYQEVFARTPSIDAVYVVSASGSKHAVFIAQTMRESAVPVYLITSTSNAPAAQYIPKERVFVFPHIREPYTYNTSTYFGMLLGNSTESPTEIREYIESTVAPALNNLSDTYTSFVCTVPPRFGLIRPMLETKFDELFAPIITGRSFTSEEIKHAKIVVQSDTQCVLNFGTEANGYVPKAQQIHIPLPHACGPVAMLAIAYYVIGRIQKQHEPYFKQSIGGYVARASEVFGQSVLVIVP